MRTDQLITTAAPGPTSATADVGTDVEPPWGRARLLDAVGGTGGLVDGGLPPVVFVVVNSLVASAGDRRVALLAAVGAAAATALALVAVRLVRRETLRRTVPGLAGIAVAAAFAARSGEARAFFLPGIYVDAAYAAVFAGSAVVGRPLAGVVHGFVYGQRGRWRTDPRLRRIFAVATVGWSLVFAARAGVQAFFYSGDRPGLLAVGKLLMGWPLTVLAVVLTLAYLRSAWPAGPAPSTEAASGRGSLDARRA